MLRALSVASPERSALTLAMVTVGCTSTVAQLILLRELLTVFYGNELTLGLILAVWLAWVAAGAWGLARSAARSGAAGMAAGLAAVCGLLPLQLLLVRASRSLLGVTPGALLPLGPMLAIIVATLAPLCLLGGWQFTLGARLMTKWGGSAGRAYVSESMGAVVGGVLFTFGLVRWLDPFQIALVVGALNLGVAAVVTRRYLVLLALPGVDERYLGQRPVGARGGGRTRRQAWFLLSGAVALLVAALPLGGWLHRTTLDWQYDGLRFAEDSIFGRLVVTGHAGQRTFFENGLLFFETQGARAEEVAHLPLLAHPQPRRVLLVGGGASGTLAEALRHPSIEAAYYVEMDPLVLIAARSELLPDEVSALADPRVTVAHVDGRLYVRRARLAQQAFDVVILDLPEPATGQLNRFFTKEFFAEVRSVLAPGGIFALGLPWQENYPDLALQHLAASVYRTLALQFPQIAVLPGERLFMLASDQALHVDAVSMGARLAERKITPRWVVLSYLDYLLTNDRIAQALHLLETVPGTRTNRDLVPICYFYDMAVWLSRFSNRLARLAVEAPASWLGWLAVPLAGAILVVRHPRLGGRRNWAVPAAVLLIGQAEMALETVVLFSFQVVHGYLYGLLGIIVAAFMAGLACGGAVGNRWLARGRHGAGASPRMTLSWILVGLVLFTFGLRFCLEAAPPVWAFPLAGLIAAGLAGMSFPVAVACAHQQRDLHSLPLSRQHEPVAPADQSIGSVAGSLYGADLVGGCLGAVLTSTLLVPILGLPTTCLSAAALALTGLIFLI